MNVITNDIYYVGVNDKKIDLFESMYKVPQGMAYNSYVIVDDKIAVLDTVDANFTVEWLENVERVLGGRKPDYLIINHMEPDHSANILNFIKKYEGVQLVGNSKTFVMMHDYFGGDFADGAVIVKEGDVLSLGKHELTFIFAPLVHWPEVMMTYDKTSKTLFSADAFGKFGALDCDGEWEDEARRYYFGIVGKFGVQVQNVLKKASGLEIARICSLHGPVLSENINRYVGLYDKWSRYEPECEGVMIAYTSVYGHTASAAKLLASHLSTRGVKDVVLYDLVRSDRSQCVADAFRYNTLVLATTTYNGDIFPHMREFIDCLVERNYQKRKIALIENGSWAPVAARIIASKFEKCKNISFTENTVKILSALNLESLTQLSALADEIASNIAK